MDTSIPTEVINPEANNNQGKEEDCFPLTKPAKGFKVGFFSPLKYLVFL